MTPRTARTLPHMTPEARRYVLKELARRAGVSRDFFDRWIIESGQERTVISFGAKGRLIFHHREPNVCAPLADQDIPIARAKWLHDLGKETIDRDLIVPFCNSDPDRPAPLYEHAENGDLVCELDLLSSLAYTLSRVEETLTEERDEHGRFPASSSAAVRHQFLERPIVDEHGLAFEQALSVLLPAWQPKPRQLRYKLTHDVDDIGMPFQLRTSIAHALKRRSITATFRDLISQVSETEPAELMLVRKLAAFSGSRGLRSAFYWKASAAGPHDSGYDPMCRKVQRVISYLRESGFELGVHPGYNTFGDAGKLASEIEYLRKSLRVQSLGGRQHYLRWSPNSWLDWEACGLKYDSSLGFADRFGFRAGTAYAYRPWSWEHNRETAIIEIPLVLMDCTPVKYLRLSREEALPRIQAMVKRIAHTGGIFTLLWHNTPLMDPVYKGWYEPILNLLEGAPAFEAPDRANELW